MWNRVNEAIDTIIRRDESTETGPLLPPCVEGIVTFVVSFFNAFLSLRKLLTS